MALRTFEAGDFPGGAVLVDGAQDRPAGLSIRPLLGDVERRPVGREGRVDHREGRRAVLASLVAQRRLARDDLRNRYHSGFFKMP